MGFGEDRSRAAVDRHDADHLLLQRCKGYTQRDHRSTQKKRDGPALLRQEPTCDHRQGQRKNGHVVRLLCNEFER